MIPTFNRLTLPTLEYRFDLSLVEIKLYLSQLTEDVSIESNIIIGYSSMPGYVAWKDTIRGSCFIQSVCDIFAENAHRIDILRLMTMVTIEFLNGGGK
jgi:hypothetical protein